MAENRQTANDSGVGLSGLLGGALIVWKPNPVLTFGEQLLFVAASKDGFRGFQFQYSLVSQAIIRSLGIPSHILFGECNYSSWRTQCF